MASKVLSFTKEERLCSKKQLTALFSNGSSFLLYPFRVTWLLNPNQSQNFPVQVVISVPKKRFKLSVDRNLIKRKTKEAYRLNKEEFLYFFLGDKKVLLNLNYVGNEIHEFNFIKKKLKVVFSMLVKQIEANENN